MSGGWIRRLAAVLAAPAALLLAVGASVTAVGLEALAPLLVAVDVRFGAAPTSCWVVLALLGLGVFGSRPRSSAATARGGWPPTCSDLRRAVFATVQRLDGGKQDALRTGQVVSRSISDLQLINALLSMFPLAAGTAVLAVFALAAMLWLSPLLTVVALIVAPLIGVVSARSKKALFPAAWWRQQAADIANRSRRP